MLVRDIMTTNVVTIPSSTPIMDARKIMEAHKFERLPVVDKGKLVGIVTKNVLQRAAPSAATSLSVWEINYLLAKMTVREAMRKSVITVSPDASVEAAATLAQNHGVGSLPVVENDKLVGILTTNDYFYKILNPLLGINVSGQRIVVREGGTPDRICKTMQILQEEGVAVKAIYTSGTEDAAEKDLFLHLDTEDMKKVTTINERLGKMGIRSDVREPV
ncbi:MAG: CBS domain-containing protein [Dehalococcoidia bacterium]|nr:CBS domain-containing protein [Dehalococcoidia bacterium]